MNSISKLVLIITLMLCTSIGNYAVDAAEGKCETANQYACPNSCTGFVSDCFECVGYFNTGKKFINFVV